MMGLFWGSTFMSTQLKLKLLLNSVECLPGENHVYSTALHNQCRALCVCVRESPRNHLLTTHDPIACPAVNAIAPAIALLLHTCL